MRAGGPVQFVHRLHNTFPLFSQGAVHTFLDEEPYLVQAYSGGDLRGFMLDIVYTCYGRRGR